MSSRALTRGWWAVKNVVAPILLAWLVTRGLFENVSRFDRQFAAYHRDAFGPIRMRLKLPGTNAGIPEPLLTCGRAGDASIAYIRLLPHGLAKVGVDFWGLRSDESEEFRLPAPDAEIEVDLYFPWLFPNVGDSDWGSLGPGFQRVRHSEYVITVDRVARLRAPVTYDLPKHFSIEYGENPIGGSLVSDRFTGTVLAVSQGY
jgi:hypothetical protein